MTKPLLTYPPKKVERDHPHEIFSLGHDFELDQNFEFEPMASKPSWSVFYGDILFSSVEQDFLSNFSSMLNGFVLGYMNPDREYLIDQYLSFQEVIVDELPALLCRIHYSHESKNETSIEEVFFDKLEAHLVAQNMVQALTLMRPVIVRSL